MTPDQAGDQARDQAGPGGRAAGGADGVLVDGLRLALGTLTALPVRPPSAVDRVRARAGMLLAPLVALLP
ncbi:MAG TPA: hypothetical protein VFP72_24550, partial [Kineosporiaceae bacterium]|nr:hypothetical protein [Kineosporiaceae bacterium]